MKNYRVCFVIAFVVLLFGTCSSMPLDNTDSDSWASARRKKIKGTVRIISVIADKPGDRASLEKETAGLLPLFFLEEAFIVVSPSSPADYSAAVKVIEREYPDAWKTRRSVSVEARIWAGDGSEPLPLSAGRILNIGKKTLSSSKTLSAMLRGAVKKAVAGIPSGKRLPPSPGGEK